MDNYTIIGLFGWLLVVGVISAQVVTIWLKVAQIEEKLDAILKDRNAEQEKE
jgi:hypothetical protein